MKTRGGYDIPLGGRPGRQIDALPEPDRLHLPLTGRTLTFADVCVVHGQPVRAGDILAVDANQFSIPLLAPRAGTVDLEAADGHVTLTGLAPPTDEACDVQGDARQTLLRLGAWQFVRDARTGCVADPNTDPQAVIVSTIHLEPFIARGDVPIREDLTGLTRGLESLQSLLEYQPIYLAVPDIHSTLAEAVGQAVRGHAFVRLVSVPLKYPHDHPRLLTGRLDLNRDDDRPVWSLGVQGVLAIDRAMTQSRPCTTRVMSLAGPGVIDPTHLAVTAGYPVEPLLSERTVETPTRVICGGALTGRALAEGQLGLDAECLGITVLSERITRGFVSFARPGFDRQSFHPCFASRLRTRFAESLTTALRGERRACVACNACEDVCPAGLWPHLIHKRLESPDGIDAAEKTRIDLCVECGLCAYVCPSKIELADQFCQAKQQIAQQHIEDEQLRLEAEAEAAAANADAERQAGQEEWLT